MSKRKALYVASAVLAPIMIIALWKVLYVNLGDVISTDGPRSFFSFAFSLGVVVGLGAATEEMIL